MKIDITNAQPYLPPTSHVLITTLTPILTTDKGHVVTTPSSSEALAFWVPTLDALLQIALGPDPCPNANAIGLPVSIRRVVMRTDVEMGCGQRLSCTSSGDNIDAADVVDIGLALIEGVAFGEAQVTPTSITYLTLVSITHIK